MTQRVDEAVETVMGTLADIIVPGLSPAEQTEMYVRLGLLCVSAVQALSAEQGNDDGMPPDTVMDRMLPADEELVAIDDMRAKVDAVLLVTSWSSVGIFAGLHGSKRAPEPKVMVQIEGRWNKTEDTGKLTMLLERSTAEAAIGGLGIALDRLANPRDGFHVARPNEQ